MLPTCWSVPFKHLCISAKQYVCTATLCKLGETGSLHEGKMGDDDDDDCALVFDIGSHTTRIGFAGDDSPRRHYYTMIDERAEIIEMQRLSLQEQTQQPTLPTSLVQPIERGRTVDWDAFDLFLDQSLQRIYTLNAVNNRSILQKASILFNLPVFSSLKEQVQRCELMLEKHGSPRVGFEASGVLASYSCGRGTSIMLCSGGGATTCVPVYQGNIIYSAVNRVDFGGDDVSNYLWSFAKDRKYSDSIGQLNSHVAGYDDVIVRRSFLDPMKHKLCYLVDDSEKQQKLSKLSGSLHQRYCLPDGQTVVLEDESFLCPELLVHPALLASRQDDCLKGLPEILFDTLMKSPMDVRLDFLNNMFLAGGNTLYKGIGQRLKKDLMTKMLERFPFSSYRFNVYAPPERANSVWIGGSILASLSSFQNSWFTKAACEEHGTERMIKRIPCTLNLTRHGLKDLDL